MGGGVYLSLSLVTHPPTQPPIYFWPMIWLYLQSHLKTFLMVAIPTQKHWQETKTVKTAKTEESSIKPQFKGEYIGFFQSQKPILKRYYLLD